MLPIRNVQCPECGGPNTQMGRHIGIKHYPNCRILAFLWEEFPNLMERIEKERSVMQTLVA